ncbi:HlyD family type I secretion periplasmic adaptor subunit [Formosimonas limnophila]|uniref:HlyD family type I secretion periplasmic adaptor subunit n=1 Tax=Formosimonas limnophila TaxID=1384487 RepID=A0A8J3G0A8_9BURK|nr:HlyD family efflux transporter periplasmic adaptor subunit [Formosimonas limnophila]GHA77262.1 HlyD family type I secretion periplasmic adaptor subunit [Formosimonas limnophila]
MKWLKRLLGLSDGMTFSKDRIVLRVSLVCLIALLIWAHFSEIDTVVHAQGQVISSSHTQTIQAADGGVLIELKVVEGQSVKKGDVVAVLEKERANAAFDDVFGKVSALRMTVARLQAEVTGGSFSIPAELEAKYNDFARVQKNLYHQRKASRDESIHQLQVSRALVLKELQLNRPLVASGDVSQVEILRLERTLNDINIQIKNIESKYLQDASAEWTKAREELNSQEQILADRQQLLKHTDLIAPATGVVKSIQVTTLGGVVRSGEEIMQILPTESDFVVEAKIKPADMTFIRQGLPARVKLDAYDYSIFGVMQGEVVYISPDALLDESEKGEGVYYKAKVRIGERAFKGRASQEIEVRPGMTVTVDVLSGKRSVLSYLTKPLNKTLSESMSEK